jgi:Na+/H+ antiporter NhaA
LNPKCGAIRGSAVLGFDRERPLLRLAVRPVERFLQLEAGSASLLMAAALAALIWSNVAATSYDDFWSTRLSVEVWPLEFEEDLLHLVNDLLMAVFFYVVALEVKRELLHGSLRDSSAAAVPVAAALGTMVGGAVVYLLVNFDGGEHGCSHVSAAGGAIDPGPRAMFGVSPRARIQARPSRQAKPDLAGSGPCTGPYGATGR